MSEFINAGSQWSSKNTTKNSTVYITHVSKFRVKAKDRNNKIVKFDKNYFLENYEFKM